MMSNSNSQIEQSLLGQEVSYPTHYDPSLLFAIARQPNRDALTIPKEWYGADIWYAYEISWLNQKGKPMVAIGRFNVPWNSPNLIESKSLKLYLNSFNESHFEDVATVQQRIEQDLSKVAGVKVGVTLYNLEPYFGPSVQLLEGEVIDHLDIEVSDYQPNPDLLRCQPDSSEINKVLISHLLKSNCPVTGQPDWGTVQIKYSGPKIDTAALLRYIISFRQHTEFHEHCVERIYSDIMAHCQPTELFVMARYTRRGGLDINPWRCSHDVLVDDVRTVRQ